MRTPRSFAALLVSLLLVGACASRPSPPIPNPEPPPPACDYRPVHIYTLDAWSNPIPGVRVTQPSTGRVDISDGNGYTHRDACTSEVYTFELDGWVSKSEDLAGGVEPHRVHLVAVYVPPPPPPPHPNPVSGRMWVDDRGCFGDDNGYRTFSLIHNGDAPLRWAAGGKAKVLADWDLFAQVGYHVIRMWSSINEDGGVWSRGGDPPYPGFDFLAREDAVDILAEMIDAAAVRGMRVTVEAGGINAMNTEQERRLMTKFHAAILKAQAWKVAWVAPVNEPSSVPHTTDDNGDNTGAHLRMLVDILRGSTGVLWHLGYGSNVTWDDAGNRFSQARLTPPDQPFGYTHSYRWGRLTDKARHRFSMFYEGGFAKAKRCWVDGEGMGAPTTGAPLRHVSASHNGHEMTDESVAALAAMETIRGLGGLMCGNCVQVHKPWEQVVGFRSVPWLIRQMHRDVATFEKVHHSGDTFRGTRVFRLAPGSRVDGAISSSGKFDYVLHVERPGTYRLPVEKSFTGRVCDGGTMTCEDVSVAAGGTLTVSLTYARLITGSVTSTVH